MRKKVLVGLSGGVDSAVSALLLKEKGYDVSAGFMINYLTDDNSCPTKVDMEVAREVADYLQIPFFTFDFVEEYEKKVLNYIFDGYKRGLTPNPDVFCNTWIKFDLFLQEAISYGYDMVATGHYARIEMLNDHMSLCRGADGGKDQSYFLSALSSEQLHHAVFPIGHLQKSEVRHIAQDAGLPNADRKDSQGLCFVGKVDFPSFLKSHIPPQKGQILDENGTVLGEHDGAFQYTIGQRKGIAVGGGPALYVLHKNTETNTITVGEEQSIQLFRTECVLDNLNWLEKITFPHTCLAQIRYRQTPQICTLTSFTDKKILVNFKDPQRAITPGQVCALYDGDTVLGSGIIVQ